MEKLIVHEDLKNFLKEVDDPIAREILQYNEQAKEINYIGRSIDKPNYLSYLNRDRIKRLDKSDFWTKEKRYHAKPSKVIELLFPGKYTDKEKMEFTEKIKLQAYKEVEGLKEIKFVEGDDIAHYYLVDNYSKQGERELETDIDDTPLYQSCMRYDKCQEYFGIYTENTRQVSLALITDDADQVMARCIVWFPQGKNDPDVKYYDRIYYIHYDDCLKMQAGLEKMGFKNISPKNQGIRPDGSVSIKLDKCYPDFEYYPYIDTFRWYDEGRLYNYETGTIEFSDTDGGYSEKDTCGRCGEGCNGESNYIQRGDYRYENLCEDCCVYSEHYDEHISTSNSVYVPCLDDHLLESDCIRDYGDECIPKDDSKLLYNGKYAWEDDIDLMCTHDYEYFISGDENFVEVGGEWYHVNDDAIEETEDGYQLKQEA